MVPAQERADPPFGERHHVDSVSNTSHFLDCSLKVDYKSVYKYKELWIRRGGMDLLDFAVSPLSNYLPQAAYAAVRERALRKTFDDGQAIHARGDDSVRLCIVASGAVKIGRFQYGGAFNLLSMLGPGGHFGDVALIRTVRTHNAYAVGPTEVDVVNASTLEDLLRNEPDFAIGLWRCNAARLNAVSELYDDVRTLDVTQRLAKVLYVHTGRGELENGVACGQRDLANLLGVSAVSIGNALKELKAAGLASSGYRSVIVPDKKRLKDWLRASGAV